MRIEQVNPKILKPTEYNPRQMTKKQVKDLTESIKQFGLVDPLIINRYKGRENVVIGGHQRLKIAILEEFKKVPVIYVNLNKEKEQELNLRLNKNLGEWDWDLLANFEKDLLKNIGFEEEELNKMLGLDEVTEDEVPEPPKEAKSKLGDLYQLGGEVYCPECKKMHKIT